jgi:hypothetical protein
MVHATLVRLTLVAAMTLVGLGTLAGVARGQVASPVAGTPVSGQEEAGFNASEQAYLDAMTPIVTAVRDSLDRYAALSQNHQFLNVEWLAKFAFELMLWRSAYDDARALEPPPALAESHGRYLEALGLLAEASDDVSAAVNEGDLVGLMAIGTKVTRATSLFDQATALMEGVIAARGGVRPVASPAAGTPVSGQAASAVTQPETAGDAALATPPAGGEVAGQVNVMVEVNTYVGLGNLSTGEHVIHANETGACAPPGDEP